MKSERQAREREGDRDGGQGRVAGREGETEGGKEGERKRICINTRNIYRFLQ